MLDLNKKFEKESGRSLWKDAMSLIAKGKIFSGSTRAFFTKDFNEFRSFKPFVGDMDVQVPESVMKDLKPFLVKHTGKKFGEFTWVGFTNSGMQYNGLLTPPKKFQSASKYIQLDFEGTPFGNGDEAPTEFAEFGHYSSWTDIKKGVKGLFIKYLIRGLSSAIKKEKIALVGKSGKRLKRGDLQGFYGFSVDKGFRLKIEPVIDENGNIVITDGLPTYKEIPSKTAKYEQNVGKIFSILFGKIPNDIEKRSMFSFVKTLDLIAQNIDQKKIIGIHDSFVKLLWSKAGQQIERGNPTLDAEIKNAAYGELLKKFPYLKGKKKEVELMYNEFYKNYKV